MPWRDTAGGLREFGAAYYADLLREMGVTVVVGLGRVEYDRAPLEAAGIAVCTAEDLGGGERDEWPSMQVTRGNSIFSWIKTTDPSF